MPTQMSAAKEGRITPEMIAAAEHEGVSPESLAQDIAAGVTALPFNIARKRDPKLARAIGRGLSIKTNANIGTSFDSCNLDVEIEKLKAAELAGADAVMDLSTAGDLRAIRKNLIGQTNMVFGSVPIYDAAVEAAQRAGTVLDMTADGMFDAVRRHAEDGCDFVTVHAAVTKRVIAPLGDIDDPSTGRRCGTVSRGGTFLARWIQKYNEENPFYANYDRLLDIAEEFDVTISLGDGMRPGALADAGDEAQMAELVEIASLVKRARERNVQVMVEGPGHVPLHEVRSQIEIAKKLTLDAPLYVLGPLVTDVAAGYDHIGAAIGGAIAGWAGVDFLCIVTPAEHLALPTPHQVHEGVIAARIAGHAGEIARGDARAIEWDNRVTDLRRGQDFDAMIDNLIDPETAREVRSKGLPADAGTCSMCGPYCVFKKPGAKD